MSRASLVADFHVARMLWCVRRVMPWRFFLPNAALLLCFASTCSGGPTDTSHIDNDFSAAGVDSDARKARRRRTGWKLWQ